MSNYARRPGRILAGVLAGAMALSVTPILGFTGVASAQEVADPIGAGNFCEDVPQTEPFTDVQATDPAFGEIVCLVATEITTGVTATTYEPNSFVTRRQMALFLVRLATEANRLEFGDNINELPAPADTDFSDTEDEEQFIEDAISQITQAEIAEGFPDGTYRPAAPVSRRQMAAFIDRTYEFLTGTALPRSATDHFADDNNDSAEAQASTNAVAEAGIFIGNADGTFAPADEITRRQMASVITRTLQVLFENGEITQWRAKPDSAAATTRPELVSASLGSTTTTGQISPTNPAGTRVTYVFDENIDLFAPTGGNFHVYNADGTNADAGTGVIISRSGDTVVVNFPGINTAALAAPLTLATVDVNAVTDNQGQGNPEGDAAIGTAAGPGTVGSAGITNAPDLVSVGNFRPAATAGFTAVDFTFDEAAFVEVVGGFDLIAVNGAELNCTGPAIASTTPSGGTSPGGNGTTVITVTCDNIVAATTLTAAAIARGTVVAGSLSDAAAPGTGNLNQLQAADVSGTSSEPDLVSATFQPSAGTAEDQVLFVFDENVATAVSGNFGVYDISGNLAVGTVTAAVINPSNRTQVLVSFPDTTLSDAVGVNVEDGAVTASDNGLPNQQDEVGVANPQTTAGRTPGETAAPQLVGVALAPTTDPFGNPSGFSATYTFDENVDLLSNTDFILYLADGTRLVASACTSGTATTTDVADDATVTCTAYGVATAAQIGAATLGTVDDGAVDEKGAAGLVNPEGAAVTTGGTGTPAA